MVDIHEHDYYGYVEPSSLPGEDATTFSHPEELKKEIEKLRKEVEKLSLQLEERAKKELRLKDRLKKLEKDKAFLAELVEKEAEGCKSCMNLKREIAELKETLSFIETERYIEFLEERVSLKGDYLAYLRETVVARLDEARKFWEKAGQETEKLKRQVSLYKRIGAMSFLVSLVLLLVVVYLLFFRG